jgi:hypothetical protein
MDSYTIILPNEKKRTYSAVTILIAILNFSGFIYLNMHVTDDASRFVSLFGAIAFCSPVSIFWAFKKQWVYILMSFLIAILIAAICWMFVNMIVFALLDLTFSVLGFIAFRKLKLNINKAQISIPSFPKKVYEWNELDNLILKDNILTIDFKNNKLLQFTLNEADNKNLDDANFNRFVQEQMTINHNHHQ